jgi:hypothetical protein
MEIDNDIAGLSRDPELERMIAEMDAQGVERREQIKRIKAYAKAPQRQPADMTDEDTPVAAASRGRNAQGTRQELQCRAGDDFTAGGVGKPEENMPTLDTYYPDLY